MVSLISPADGAMLARDFLREVGWSQVDRFPFERLAEAEFQRDLRACVLALTVLDLGPLLPASSFALIE